MRVPAMSWVLAGFFFFAGVALTAWEETRWIGIGQIWIAVSVLLIFVFILAGRRKSGARVGRTAGEGGAPAPAPAAAVGPEPAHSPNEAARLLERLEQRRQKGELSDADYQAERDRILAEA
jgi:hypothetical protein